MLFLSFLWLYFCTIFVSARPIFKSMANESIFENKIDTVNNAQHDRENYHYYNRFRSKYQTNKKNMISSKILSSNIHSNVKYRLLKRKLTSTSIDPEDFEKYQPSSKDRLFQISHNKIYRPTTSSDNDLTSVIAILSTEVNNLRDLYGLSKMKINQHNNNPFEIDTKNDVDFAETEEIEAILNQIKQREIEMIAEQAPSVTELITNSVTETSYTSVPFNPTKMIPGLAFSTYLAINNGDAEKKRFTTKAQNYDKLHKHNLLKRSIKGDAYTLAQSIEDKLQHGLKNVYKKVKNKISKDLSKEVKTSSATIKSHIDKLKGKLIGPTKTPKKSDKNIMEPKKKLLTAIRGSRSTLKCNNVQNNIDVSVSLPMQTTLKLVDDYTLISMFEQMLSKSHEDNIMKMLTTQNASMIHQNNDDRLARRNSQKLLGIVNLDESNKLIYDNDEEIQTDVIENMNTNENMSTISHVIDMHKKQNEPLDAGRNTSFEALSNKISYNDYVNGYKYYLNFQKEQGHQNYSNMVKYQAHKHHSVDDIGKYILNKIPHISSTRFRRDIVDSETLEDQDVSSKSEDSWFKRHFFVFLDTSPPKKFHSTQMVRLKSPGTETNLMNTVTKVTVANKRKNKFKHIFATKTHGSIDATTTVSDKKHKKIASKKNNSEKYDILQDQIQLNSMTVRPKRNDIGNVRTQTTKRCNNQESKGFVDINLIQKPTAVVKLHNINRHNNKIKSFFNKFHGHRNKQKKIKKRQNQNRIQRFNPFKEIKNIFKCQHTYETTKPRKFYSDEMITFDMARAKPYSQIHINKMVKIQDMMKQIPNITSDFHFPYSYVGSDSYNSNSNAIITTPQSLNLFDSKSQFLDELQRLGLPSEAVNIKSVMNPYIQKENKYKFSNNRNIYDDILKNKVPQSSKSPMEVINLPYAKNEGIQNKADYSIPKLLDLELQLAFSTLPTLQNYDKEQRRKYSRKFYTTTNSRKYPFKNAESNNMYEKNLNSKKYWTTQKPFSSMVDVPMLKNTNENNLDTGYNHVLSQFTSVNDKVTRKGPRYTFKIDENNIFDSTTKAYKYSSPNENEFEPENTYKNVDKSNIYNIYMKNPSKSSSMNGRTLYILYTPKMNRIQPIHQPSKLKMGKQNNMQLFSETTKSTFNKPIFTGPSKSSDKNNEILVEDITIFAYDDVINNLKHNLHSRKLAESSTASNNNFDRLLMKTKTEMNTLPKQHFTTPLPMQREIFNKFLKDEQIDVESVTAPLQNSVFAIKQTRNYNTFNKSPDKPNISSKIPNVQNNYKSFNLKTTNVNIYQNNDATESQTNNFGNTFNSKKMDSAEYTYRNNRNQHKNVKNKYENKEKQLNKGLMDYKLAPDAALKNIENIKILNLQKTKKPLKATKLTTMKYHYFSEKNTKNENDSIDFTIIDLEAKRITHLRDYKLSHINCKNKKQTSQKATNNKILFTGKFNELKKSKLNNHNDPLRFSNMKFDKSYSPAFPVNPTVTTYIFKKASRTATAPKRIQISGHSYKYDIVYHHDPKTYLLKDHKICMRSPRLSLKEAGAGSANNNAVPLPIEIRNTNGSEYRMRSRRHCKSTSSIKSSTTKSLNRRSTGKGLRLRNLKLALLSPSRHSKTFATVVTKKIKDNTDPMKSKVIYSRESTSNTKDFQGPIIQFKLNKKSTTKLEKRDVQTQNTFTAKDVAALEVVVDLMRGNQTYEDIEDNIAHIEDNPHSKDQYLISQVKENQVTNSIQVHIAVPYNSINDDKRSLQPIKVRKVFSAFMSTPVDLQYQIHSFDDSTTASLLDSQDMLSPGLYLLVENTNVSYPKGDLVLKPVNSDLYKSKNFFMRQATQPVLVTKTSSSNVISHSHDIFNSSFSRTNNENTNNHSIMTANLKSKRHSKIKEYILKRNEQSGFTLMRTKRHLKWDSVKKYFGHDRVCHCYCKVNKTMCKTCAASDNVISELMFDFENLAKYMVDHCTEIQTFLWMNPTDGRKLRETVHKIDNILNDYYKRVKGKCQGRTCKMLSSRIDKRGYTKDGSILDIFEAHVMINKLCELADKLENISDEQICCNSILSNGRTLMNAINCCITTSPKSRHFTEKQTKRSPLRSIYTPNIRDKNIYSTQEPSESVTFSTLTSALSLGKMTDSTKILIIDSDDEIKKNKKMQKYKKKIKNIYPKNLVFSKDNNNNGGISKPISKRQIKLANQAESPLLSDVGGSFWYEYIKSNSEKPRYPRESLKNPIIEMFVIPDKNKCSNSPSKIASKTSNTKLKTKSTNTVSTKKDRLNTQDNKNTDYDMPNIDSLNYNMNELFKLLGSAETNQENLITTQIISNKDQNKATPKRNRNEQFSNKKTKHDIEQKSSKIDSNILVTTKQVTKFYHKSPSGKLDGKKLQTYRKKGKTLKSNLINRFKSVTSRVVNKLEKGKSLTNKHITPAQIITNKDKRKKKYLRWKKHPQSTEINYFIDDTTYQISNNSNDDSNMTTSKNPTIIIFDDTEYKRSSNFPLPYNVSLNTRNNYVNASFGDYYNSMKNTITGQYKTSEKSFKSGRHTNKVDNHIKGNTMTSGVRLAKNLTSPNVRGLVNRIVDILSNRILDEKQTKKHRCKNNKTTIIELKHPKTYFKTRTRKKGQEIRKRRLDAICDLPSTIVHTLSMQRRMQRADFHKYVKNLNCYKYKLVPEYFQVQFCKLHLVKHPQKKWKGNKRRHKTEEPKWDWIREKRSPMLNKKDIKCDSKNKDGYITQDNKVMVQANNFMKNNYGSGDIMFNNKEMKNGFVFLDYIDEKYEIMCRGHNNIYKRCVEHKKRTASDLFELKKGLKNLPPLRPITDETYVTVGDTISFHCSAADPFMKNDEAQYNWNSDRNGIQNLDNVLINGSRITMRNIRAENSGNYRCSKAGAIIRNIKLTVIGLPEFNIVFTPVYKCEQNCTYEDLKSIQRVGAVISHEACGKYCSVKIEEPICMMDKRDGSSFIKTVVVISSPKPRISCNTECRRDLQTAFALLSAINAPALASVNIKLSCGNKNRTFTPAFENRNRTYITHTLRRKDSRSYRYYDLISGMESGSVKVLATCSGGFYLVADQKICAVCPTDTYSADGDNVCRTCPLGASSKPGSHECHTTLHRVRRDNINWKNNEWIIAATCLTILGLTGLCYGLNRLLNRPTKNEPTEVRKPNRRHRKCRSNQRASRTRPLSPSRVILSRLLKGSPSSSRATDSQETRFELWKERNTLPPLPPIDFEL